MNVSVVAARRLAGWIGHRLFRNRREPSMRSYVEGLRARHARQGEIQGIHRLGLFDWATKSGAKRIAEGCHVDTARTLAGPCPPGHLPWDELGDQFVVKPDWGAASEGVHVLKREHDGRLWCELSRRAWTADELIDELSHLAEAGRVSSSVIAEQRIGGALPYDWKVYCFAGRVGLVLQIDRRSGRSRYYDHNWAPLRAVNWCKPHGRHLPPPENPAGIIEAAEKLSTQVDEPFVRIDLYELGGRVLFGEMGPTPGQQYWFARWDRRLGQMWENAQSRMKP